jgi:hypothetical protein
MPSSREPELTGRLINVMRAHGIQPVAIWDKPGKRKWKEPEVSQAKHAPNRLLSLPKLMSWEGWRRR